MGLAGTRVLVVEDEALVSMLVEEYLDELGCEVVGVASRWDPVPWWSVTGVLGGRPGTGEFGGLAVDVTEPGSGADSVRSAHSRYFDPGTV